jgi:hypothetical protein
MPTIYGSHTGLAPLGDGVSVSVGGTNKGLNLNGQPFYPIGWVSTAALYLKNSPVLYSPNNSGDTQDLSRFWYYQAAYQQYTATTGTGGISPLCEGMADWHTNTVRFQVIPSILCDTDVIPSGADAGKTYSAAYIEQIHALVTATENDLGAVVILSMQQNLPEPLGLRTGPYAGRISTIAEATASPYSYVNYDKGNTPAQQAVCTAAWASLLSIDATHNTEKAWRILAPEFSSDPYVMFEIINEPNYSDWGDFATPGTWVYDHNACIQAIGDVGATNTVLVDGLANWACGFPHNNVQDKNGRPFPNFDYSSMGLGANVVYSVHPQYAGYIGGMGTDHYDKAWGWLTANAPVMITEFYNTITDSQWSTLSGYIASKQVGLLGWDIDSPNNPHMVSITDKATGAQITDDTADYTQPWKFTTTSTGTKVQAWMQTYTSPPVPPPTPDPTHPGLTVGSGQKIILNGSEFIPIGWNSVAGLYTPSNPYTSAYPNTVQYQASYEQFTMAGSTTCTHIQEWGANTIRFNIIQNILTAGSPYTSDYIAQLHQLVDTAHSFGCAVILCIQNNHGGNQGIGQGTASQGLGPYFAIPTTPSDSWSDSSFSSRGCQSGGYNCVDSTHNTVCAWQALAPEFADDPMVMFELFNEPRISKSQWNVGTEIPCKRKFSFVGRYQALIDAVRGTGATNILIIDAASADTWVDSAPFYGMKHLGCATWEGFEGHDDWVSDPNIAYAVHRYQGAATDWGDAYNTAWTNQWGWMSNNHPVIFTEWYATYLKAHQDRHKQVLTAENRFLAYVKEAKIGVIGWVFDHFTDPNPAGNQLMGYQTLNGARIAVGDDFSIPWVFVASPTGQTFFAWCTGQPMINLDPAIPTAWRVNIYKNDQRQTVNGWPLSVSKVVTFDRSLPYGARSYHIQLNLTDIETIPPLSTSPNSNEGMWIEVYTNDVPKGAGYVYQTQKSFPYLDIWFQGAEVELSKYRSADVQKMKYPDYCRKDTGVLDLVNGLYDPSTKTTGDTPYHLGLGPKGWVGTWVDGWNKPPTKPPGYGTSWEVDLDTCQNSLDGLAAHFNYHIRFAEWKNNKGQWVLNKKNYGRIWMGPFGDKSGVTIWGGDALKTELARRGYPQSSLGDAGLAQRLGYAVITDVQYTNTFDNIFNLFAAPGAKTTNGDPISLADLWSQDPDYGKGRYIDFGEPLAPYGLYAWLDGNGNPFGPRLYYLNPVEHTRWDGHTYQLVAWQRQEGGWEYGVCDKTSCEQFGIIEGPPIHYGTNKIDNIDALLEAACGAVDYNSAPVPTWVFTVRFPRWSGDRVPPEVLPGQTIDINFRGDIPVIGPDGLTGCKYLDFAGQPEMQDTNKARLLTTVVQVDDKWDLDGYTATYTMGKGKWRKSHWEQAIARGLDHISTAHPTGGVDTLNNVSVRQFNTSVQGENNDTLSIQPGGTAISNMGDDSFYGWGVKNDPASRRVEFVYHVWDPRQALQFWFSRPPRHGDTWADCSGNPSPPTTDAHGVYTNWQVYGVLNLAMSEFPDKPDGVHATGRSGVYTTANGIYAGWTRKTLFRTKKNFWWPGKNTQYHVITHFELKTKGAYFHVEVNKKDDKKVIDSLGLIAALPSDFAYYGGIGWHLADQGTHNALVYSTHMTPTVKPSNK